MTTMVTTPVSEPGDATAALDLLAECRVLGVEVCRDGDSGLRARRPGGVPPVLLEQLRQHRAGLLQLLNPPPANGSSRAKGDDFGPCQLTLKPLPDHNGVPSSIRLRRALKCLLREFGWRCTDVRPLAAGEAAEAAAATGGSAAVEGG